MQIDTYRYERVTSSETATYCPCLAVNVTRLVAAQKQGDSCDLVRDCPSHERIQLANLPFSPSRSCSLVHATRHAGLDHTRADCVTSDAGTSKLIARTLHYTDDGSLGSRVVRCPCIRSQTCGRCSPNDGSTWIWLFRRGFQHASRAVFDRKEYTALISMKSGNIVRPLT